MNQPLMSHRMIRKLTDNLNQKRRRSDKALVRAFDGPKLTSLKRSMSRKTLSTSRKVFGDAGVNLPCRVTRCKVLKAIGSIRKPKKQPPLSKVNMQKLSLIHI